MFRIPPLVPAVVGAFSAIALLTAAAQPAHAQSAEELRRMIERQQQELDTMRQRLNQLEQDRKQTAADNVVTGGDFPGSFKLPGTDTSVKIGGYVKGDAIYDMQAGSGDIFIPALIPVTGTGDGQTRMHARQSRLNIDVRTPTDMGPLRVFVETDFFGTGGNEIQTNSTSPRLRHAFGTLGNFLAGQTWSTFMDVGALPETLDFAGPNGAVFVRQAQLRWNSPVGDGVNLALAIENPEGDIENGAGLNLDQWPDGIARLTYSQDWGHVQGGALLRQIRLDNAAGIEETAFGYGLSFSGRLNVPMVGAKDNFKFQANYGDGIGRYITDLGFAGDQDAVFTAANRDLQTLKAFGAYGAYQHWWRDDLRSTVVYSHVQVDNEAGQAGTAYHQGQYAAVNLIWSPVKWADVGMEYLFGSVEKNNGTDADDSRLQASATFKF
jgi:hypothetical protein